MPFALVFVGLLLIITGFQNTYKQFGAQVQGDFSGKGNFLYWLLAILIVGAIGYVKSLQGFSRAFMALILLSILLSNKSGTAQGITFFSNLVTGVNTGSTTQVDSIGDPLQGGNTASSGNSSGGGFDLSNIGQDASIAATVSSFL